MPTKSQSIRPLKYALISSGLAGLVSVVLTGLFIDMLTLVFIPAVMIMVFVSAYFAFRRQMRNRGALAGRRIFHIALEVGTLSHFYTFALYFPLAYFTDSLGSITSEMSLELVMSYVISALAGGLVSLIFFFWLSIPMYLGVGYIIKAMEGDEFPDSETLNESLLDDVIVETEVDPLD